MKVEVNKRSERMKIMEKFDVWNGKDIVEINVLIKVKGKWKKDKI